MLIHSARAFSAALLVAGLAACSGGDSTLNPQPTIVQKNATDTNFINGAAMSSNGEIGDAKLALTRSQNADVLAFAQKMITDHTGENEALDPIGDALGQPPPTGVGPAMVTVSNSLMPLSGPTFDAAYIDSEIAGHQMNLDNNYIPELQLGLNARVVGYAKTYDPQVSSHLALAQSIKAKYGFS